MTEKSKAAACRVCGCTDAVACPGGCSWTEPDLCSSCAAPILQQLQSDDPNDVGRGMARCWPAHGSCLVRVDNQSGNASLNVAGLDPQRLFIALLAVTAHVGNQLGLSLQWVPQAAKKPGIILPSPKSGPFR